jgi:hypothetical protein
MEICSKDMIKCYLNELNNDVVRSPTKSGDSSCGYSPENGTNAKHLKQKDSVHKTTLNREQAINKQMEKLKNFGTITISDTDDETVKLKKRGISKGTYVRNDKERKRQNTTQGTTQGNIPNVEIAENNCKGKEIEDNCNKPFYSDYRRGVTTPVMHT